MLFSPKVLVGALVIGAVLAPCSQASASERGSPEDQLACTPDVYRLCSSFVPDEDAIVACLNRNVNTLSAACKRVMSRPASTAPNANGGDDD